jgi:hypothetical protein
MIHKVCFVAMAALAFLASEPAQAVSSQVGPGPINGSEIKGAGVLMRLAVPFGGRQREKIPARFTLTTGPVTQEPTDAFVAGRVNYSPSAELGLSLKGDPVLKVGQIDLSDAIKTRAEKRARARPMSRNRSGGWRLLHR